MKNETMFDRTRNAYDIELLSKSRVVIVGCGGSRSFIETLGRTGVGEMVLIDPDVSSVANIGTQAAYRNEVGLPKVEAMRNRLLQVSPASTVRTMQQTFQSIDKQVLEELLLGAWGAGASPAQTLLVLTTDNFEAQAHGNRVALHYGIPSLAGQMYQNGAAAEITYTHPDATRACHRCALAGRYKAYLEDGFFNNVTSHGTPVFCADRINAMLGMMALMLLHQRSKHERWTGLLERADNRNLIQIQMWPDTPLKVFERVFGKADQARLFFDNTVWLPQEPDHPHSNGYPVCPDCRGTGDLHNVIGSFASDLYQMRMSV